TPTEVGDYEILVRSSGDMSGTTHIDTLRLHVRNTSGIEQLQSASSDVKQFYSPLGLRITNPKKGHLYIINRKKIVY
ncbi:MAG: hypothetical protein IJ984_07900, partial [Prevotella sp.]|nr:hypothetical protein [Prevotella sp.]